IESSYALRIMPIHRIVHTTGTHYPLANLGRTLGGCVARKLFELNCGNADVNVYAIPSVKRAQKQTLNLSAIVIALSIVSCGVTYLLSLCSSEARSRI
ncbi:MAG: hypothetical protein WAV47_14385, partial [Blastocatellia bacterium]